MFQVVKFLTETLLNKIYIQVVHNLPCVVVNLDRVMYFLSFRLFNLFLRSSAKKNSSWKVCNIAQKVLFRGQIFFRLFFKLLKFLKKQHSP
jgi:hypothetical protein